MKRKLGKRLVKVCLQLDSRRIHKSGKSEMARKEVRRMAMIDRVQVGKLLQARYRPTQQERRMRGQEEREEGIKRDHLVRDLDAMNRRSS
jgi:hypothetical protein